MIACTFWKQSVFPPLGILFNGPMFCCYHILCLASAPSASLRMTLSSSLFFCSYAIPKTRTYTKTLYLHYKMGSLPSTHTHTHTQFLEVFYYPSVCVWHVSSSWGRSGSNALHSLRLRVHATHYLQPLQIHLRACLLPCIDLFVLSPLIHQGMYFIKDTLCCCEGSWWYCVAQTCVCS